MKFVIIVFLLVLLMMVPTISTVDGLTTTVESNVTITKDSPTKMKMVDQRSGGGGGGSSSSSSSASSSSNSEGSTDNSNTVSNSPTAADSPTHGQTTTTTSSSSQSSSTSSSSSSSGTGSSSGGGFVNDMVDNIKQIFFQGGNNNQPTVKEQPVNEKSITNELLSLKAEPRELIPFSCEPNCQVYGVQLERFVQPEVVIPTAAAVGTGVVMSVASSSSFSFPGLKPIGFTAASAKTYRVARMYKKSMLFSKTQKALSLGFVSLAAASILGFIYSENSMIGFGAASWALYLGFLGLVAYHHKTWYEMFRYSTVGKLPRQILIMFSVLGLITYLYLVFTETIPFDVTQGIMVVVGLLMIVPLTVFITLNYRESINDLTWGLLSVGLASIMIGIIIPTSLLFNWIIGIGDLMVLSGCGCIIASQYNLSTQYITE